MVPMATIYDNAIKKSVDEAKGELARILAGCRAHICHVGMTNNVKIRQYGPPYRWVRVNGTKHEGYVTEIHVIYETPSRSTCRDAERQLIEHARGLIGDFEETEMVLGNSRGGGGGPSTDNGPHVVYVALGG
jgi:hypothetical protein